MSLNTDRKKYSDVVRKAKSARKDPYGNEKIKYAPCEIWLNGDQINLWTYWQGYQLDDIDNKGVDIMLVGQDWGNPNAEKNSEVCRRIREIQAGSKMMRYLATDSPTDRNLTKLFMSFGNHMDITKPDPGMRLFFTNYSLGYRTESETGGMTKSLMSKDKDFFEELVSAINPKIIICLGKITYEMVSGESAKDFVKTLRCGNPFRSTLPSNPDIIVYGVAHCGVRGSSNVGGIENMRRAWDRIAKEYYERIKA